MTNNKFKLKVGLFGIGLEAYWEQFQGLKKRLESYLEIVSNRIGEFGEEVVNHDCSEHIKIVQDKTKVHPLTVYHGKVGNGLSVEMAVKYVSITCLSVVEGTILEIGNTNSRYKFNIGAKNFVNDWNSNDPAHYCAIGVGHIASKIKKLGNLFGIETVQVC